MKKSRYLGWRFIAAIIALGALGAGCQTAKLTEPSLPTTVLHIKGAVRWRPMDGTNWVALKVKDLLRAGIEIQTAKGAYVDIAVLEEVASRRHNDGQNLFTALKIFGPAGAPHYLRTIITNHIRILGDTTLEIEKLTARKPAGSSDWIKNRRFVLHAGKVHGYSETIRGDSTYEVSVVNAVVKVRQGMFVVESDGVVSVIRGTVTVAGGDRAKEVEVPGAHSFNIGTGEIARLPLSGHSVPGPIFSPFIKAMTFKEEVRVKPFSRRIF